MRVIELHKSVTDSNDRDAEILRQQFESRGILLINLMSSAGSGKTTLLERTITDLRNKVNIAVLEADIDASVDAERIEALGAQSVQVHTDGMCHMDAGMTAEGLKAMDLEKTDIAFLENIGNLICPAEYATGASRNVMILSIPEGDDKPLKYPLMFEESDVLLITKTDTRPYFRFDMKKCVERVRFLNPDITIYPVSAKTGEGMEEWENWLLEQSEIIKGKVK
ncbi:MAG: hydrogenase nickel incorporation protein HypB [Erysipelotrichaceae bacterium]|nr:hydrogenase nickel incorporation protein HypB [Erysipelotrichaceae bacterium]